MVSVVIPIYNRAEFVSDLLGSVKQQCYRPIEVVVVDDGSTDNTARVVEGWKSEQVERGLSVRYVHQRNQGAPRARNRGVALSEGRFVQFLDSDDLLHPQKIGLQVEALNRFGEADAAWGGYRFFEDGSKPTWQEYKPSDVFESLSVRKIVRPGLAGHPETALYRREAISEIGPWNENLDRWQDWEYSFRIAAHALTKVELPGTYYFLREHDAGKIGDLADSPEAVQILLRTLEAIDGVIGDLEYSPSSFHDTAFRLYLRVLGQALESGTREEVSECFRGVTRHSVTAPRRLRIWILRTIYNLFGAGVARFLKRLYSDLSTR